MTEKSILDELLVNDTKKSRIELRQETEKNVIETGDNKQKEDKKPKRTRKERKGKETETNKQNDKSSMPTTDTNKINDINKNDNENSQNTTDNSTSNGAIDDVLIDDILVELTLKLFNEGSHELHYSMLQLLETPLTTEELSKKLKHKHSRVIACIRKIEEVGLVEYDEDTGLVTLTDIAKSFKDLIFRMKEQIKPQVIESLKNNIKVNTAYKHKQHKSITPA